MLAARRFSRSGLVFRTPGQEFLEGRIHLRVVNPSRYSDRTRAVFLKDQMEAGAIFGLERGLKRDLAGERHGIGEEDAGLDEVQASIRFDTRRPKVAAGKPGQRKAKAP